MLHRRNFLALPISLMCALPDGARALESKPETPGLKVTIGGKTFVQYAPITVAERLGYFKEAGLDLEILDVAGGAKALEALIGGSADVTAGAFDHILQMQAKDQHIVGFVLFGRHPAFALAIRNDKAPMYHGPSSLRGMKVGVTALGSQTHFMVEYLAIKAGLEPSDVSFISVGSGTNAVAAIRNGAIDAVVTGEPAITTLEAAGEVKIVADARTNEGTTEIYGGLYPSGTVYARSSFIRENPRTIQAFALAMVRALKWMDLASIEEIADVLPPEWAKPDRNVLLASLRGTRDMPSPDGRFSLETAKIAYRVLSTVDPRMRNGKIDLVATFTNRFVDDAHAAIMRK